MTPGVEYEAQVQAMNKFGWSQRSEAARFMVGQQERNTPHGGHSSYLIVRQSLFNSKIIFFQPSQKSLVKGLPTQTGMDTKDMVPRRKTLVPYTDPHQIGKISFDIYCSKICDNNFITFQG